MNHWGHFFAVAAVILSIGAILVFQQLAHQRAASKLYSTYVSSHWCNGEDAVFSGSEFATEDQQKTLRDAVRDGARSADALHFETTVWAALFGVLLVVLLFYHGYAQRSLTH